MGYGNLREGDDRNLVLWGAAAELRVAALGLSRGYTVFRPLVNSPSRIDLIFMLGRKVTRIEVTAVGKETAVWREQMKRSNRRVPLFPALKKLQENSVADVVIVWYEDSDVFVIVDKKRAKGSLMTSDEARRAAKFWKGWL